LLQLHDKAYLSYQPTPQGDERGKAMYAWRKLLENMEMRVMGQPGNLPGPTSPPTFEELALFNLLKGYPYPAVVEAGTAVRTLAPAQPTDPPELGNWEACLASTDDVTILDALIELMRKAARDTAAAAEPVGNLRFITPFVHVASDHVGNQTWTAHVRDTSVPGVTCMGVVTEYRVAGVPFPYPRQQL
jgi:hypothetical protein